MLEELAVLSHVLVTVCQYVFLHVLCVCYQGQQADHVAKGVARQHELSDHHDCSYLRLTQRFLGNPFHHPDRFSCSAHEKEES